MPPMPCPERTSSSAGEVHGFSIGQAFADVLLKCLYRLAAMKRNGGFLGQNGGKSWRVTWARKQWDLWIWYIYIYILWLIYAGAKLTHKKNSMVLGKYTVTIVNGVKPTHITGGPTLPLFLSGLSARTSSGVEYCVNAVIHKTNGRKQVNFRGHSAMEGIAAQS